MMALPATRRIFSSVAHGDRAEPVADGAAGLVLAVGLKTLRDRCAHDEGEHVDLPGKESSKSISVQTC